MASIVRPAAPDASDARAVGSFLLVEPWMLSTDWAAMGGDNPSTCGDCSKCVVSEYQLVKKLGQAKANAVFEQHWNSWFNATDAALLVENGLNSVRIPVVRAVLMRLRRMPRTSA